MEKLTPGLVIEINDNFQLENNDVYARISDSDYFALVGSLEKDLMWFKQSTVPEITKVVYLGNSLFGIKQLTDPLEEFDKMSWELKNNILHNAVAYDKQVYDEYGEAR